MLLHLFLTSASIKTCRMKCNKLSAVLINTNMRMKFSSKMMARGTKVYLVSAYWIKIQRNECSDEAYLKGLELGA